MIRKNEIYYVSRCGDVHCCWLGKEKFPFTLAWLLSLLARSFIAAIYNTREIRPTRKNIARMNEHSTTVHDTDDDGEIRKKKVL